jgi:hypothetical protein
MKANAINKLQYANVVCLFICLFIARSSALFQPTPTKRLPDINTPESHLFLRRYVLEPQRKMASPQRKLARNH